MFQCLENGCVRVWTVCKNFGFRVFQLQYIFLLLLMAQSTDIMAGSASIPSWIGSRTIVSDDGYADLEWSHPVETAVDFFKITETFNGNESSTYTRETTLRAWRVEQGEYEFVLRACNRSDSGEPVCGSPSKPLSLTITEAILASLVTEEVPVRDVDLVSTPVGPGQLPPGHWYNPDKNGHGWSFYLANTLGVAPIGSDPVSDYELIGLWYTYEAKAATPDPDCPTCPLQISAYRPIVLELHASSLGNGVFSGALHAVRHSGTGQYLGNAEITFAQDNTSAEISWSVNFRKESLSATDSLVHLLGSDPASTNNITHFSGFWVRNHTSNVVANDLGEDAEAVAIVFYDDVGDPTWVQAVNYGEPVATSSDLCLAYLMDGYSPAINKPLNWSIGWFQSGCDNTLPANSSNRNGRRIFSGLNDEYIWAEFTLPETEYATGSLQIGSSDSPVLFEKAANLHGVVYDESTGTSCDSSIPNTICEVKLTWFTDGNYPDATVFAHNHSNDTYYRVLKSTQPAMINIAYQLPTIGVYDFELHMGDGVSTTLIAQSSTYTVTGTTSTDSDPEIPPEPASPPNLTPNVNSSQVGATVGEFSVDVSGSATYSIPILAAPASGGVSPQVSLNYSSQAGNGEVGVGWSIGGVSALSICPQTMEQDGVSGSRGIKLDGDDRFCLDGQRLILDPASGPYGADGTSYKTEIDNFSRITSYGSAGNGPAWFRVERKDGSVIEYGNSSDSRIEARGSVSPVTVFAWAQNRIEDRFGNYMLYNYIENSSGPVGYVLHSIDYTGNSRSATLPSARITFSYRDRDPSMDLSYSYFAGVQLEQRQLLQSIRSQGRLQAGSPLQDLRYYVLDYEEDGIGRQVLTTLTECRSTSRSTCYQPTRFDWLKSESSINSQATILSNLLPKSTLTGLLMADVNGDGRPDLLDTRTKSNQQYLYINQATANTGFTQWPVNYQLPKKSDGSAPRVFAIDVNSNGIQDVVYSKYSKTSDDYTWVVRLSSGMGLLDEVVLNPAHRFVLDEQETESQIRIMDFNGDGLSDILHMHARAVGNKRQLTVLLNTTTAGGAPVMSAPIELNVDNGDLFPDRLGAGWELANFPPVFDWDLNDFNKTDVPDAKIFDFNGDGAVDFLLNVWRNYQKCIANCQLPASPVGGGSGGKKGGKNEPEYVVEFASFWVLMESNGQSAFNRHSIVALGENCTAVEICDAAEYASLPRSPNVWPVDINADGLADLAWGDLDGNWYFQINTGNGFATANLIGPLPDGSNELVRFEDYNGDGYPDLLYPSAILADNAKWMSYQNHFGRVFASSFNTLVPAGNVGGERGSDPVENDSSIFADFNGDGKTDQLLIDNNKRGGILAVQLRKGLNASGSQVMEPANVITAITNGFGMRTEVGYLPMTDGDVYTRTYDSATANWGQGAAVYDYIAPFFVVSKVSGSAPTFSDPGALNHAEYHYVGAKLQAGGRGLLGFAEVIVYDPQLQIRINTRYRQDFPFVALPVDAARTSSSPATKFKAVTRISDTQSTSWPMVNKNTLPPVSISETLLSYSVSHWQARQSLPGSWVVDSDTSLQRTYILSGAFESKVFTQNTLDNYGNPIIADISTYEFDGDAEFSRRITNNKWSAANPVTWDLGKLLNSTVTHSRTGKSPVTRRSEFEYDVATRVLSKEIIEPGDVTLEVAQIFSYDLFGNRTVTSKKGVGMSSRTRTVTYDPLGRFVTRETNALGQDFRKIDSLKWDVFGNPLEIQNIDGVVSTNLIDLMGRPFASFNQTGAWQKTAKLTGKGESCPLGTAWHSTSTHGGDAMTRQCFDVSSRSVRNISKAMNGQFIYIDQYYDISGRPSRVSEPYFKNDTTYWNETAYDALGRITGVLSAGGDDISTNYDEQAVSSCTTSGPRVMVTTNALGQQATEVKNVLGEAVSNFDDNCGEVSFSYDSMGYLVSVTGADGSVVSMSYDGAGRKTGLNDPDKGNWQYAYNALGEMTRQLNVKQQAIDFEYGVMGRVSHRRELTGVSDLNDTAFSTANHEASTYKTTSPGKSQLSRITYRAGESGTIIHQKNTEFDWLGRTSDITTTIGTDQFFQQTTYDAYGRVFQSFDASGNDRGLRYAYSNGHLTQLREAREGVNGLVYQDILDMDARGNVTMAKLGNGVTAIADYDQASGILKNLSSYDQLGVELQDVTYLFDVLGNLKSRHDMSASSNRKEEFSYDSLNRLDQVQLTAPDLGLPSPVQTLALTYDVAGNISWKSDIGNYTYGANGAGTHAVTNAGGVTYSYDINGNQTSGNGRNISYTVFDKVANLTVGNQDTTYTYGIGNTRLERRDSVSAVVEKTTTYLGNVEYITEQGGNTMFKRYLGGSAIATYYPASSIQQLAYLLKDHIGSIHSVLDENGLITARMHFSPFGERQDSDWQTALDSFLYSPLNELTSRGFTGHEHIDSMGIINMNGRIYDAKLGRFLQADPFVQAPKNTQSLNRYSYVLNNPLSYTDPSGFFSLSRFVKRWGRTIAAIAISVILPGAGGILATQFGITSQLARFVITGFIAGGITGGIKGAVRGAFLAAVTYGVTKAFNQVPNGHVQLDEAAITPTAEDLQHMLGTGDPGAGLYRVEVGPLGEFDRASSITSNGIRSGETIFNNGVNNNFQAAVRNGTTQVAQIDRVASGYILNFNPTNTLIPDTLESVRDITSTYFGFGQTELAENLAKVIDVASKNGVTGLRIIGHSQGAAIATSALRFASDSGLNLSAVGSVNLHGAPINDIFVKNSLASRTGINSSQFFIRAQFGDPVHGILGANFISNPLRLPFSAIRIPQLFSADASLSPHTVPCFGGRTALCSG